jgi:hypothetical protein
MASLAIHPTYHLAATERITPNAGRRYAGICSAGRFRQAAPTGTGFGRRSLRKQERGFNAGIEDAAPGNGAVKRRSSAPRPRSARPTREFVAQPHDVTPQSRRRVPPHRLGIGRYFCRPAVGLHFEATELAVQSRLALGELRACKLCAFGRGLFDRTGLHRRHIKLKMCWAIPRFPCQNITDTPATGTQQKCRTPAEEGI